MKVYKVVPRLEKEKILNLWRKAQEAQWSADRIPWSAPQTVTSKVNRDRLGRVLTPILMSEQSAFHSASALLPLLGKANEVESQYYLTTWLVDEARHAELIALLYKRFDREPMSARKFPWAYLFQSHIRADDTAIFLAGLLAVEVLAKHVMTEFRRLDLDPCLTEIADRILGDEARHLGFNRLYIEDRIATLGKAELDGGEAGETDAFIGRLEERMATVIEKLPEPMTGLGDDLREIGFRADDVLDRVRPEVRTRMERAIASGLKAVGRDGYVPTFADAEELGS